jgi:hypothetical protein
MGAYDAKVCGAFSTWNVTFAYPDAGVGPLDKFVPLKEASNFLTGAFNPYWSVRTLAEFFVFC